MQFEVNLMHIKRSGYTDIYLGLRNKNEKIYIEKLTKVAVGQWDSKEGKIINHSNAQRLNFLISSAKHKLETILYDFEIRKVSRTAEEIKNAYFGKNQSESFINYAREKLKQERGIKSEKTLEGYFESIEKLRAFKPDFSFDDLTYEKLRAFESFLTTYTKNGVRRGHRINSRYQVFTLMRKINNIAISEGKTSNYPFKQFKLKTQRVKKDFLNEEETERLFEIWDTLASKRLKTTLAYYLFSCETGVSADDHRQRNFSTTDDNIYFHRKKTNEPVSVPLTDKAKYLLPYLQNHPLKLSKSRIKQDLTDVLQLVEINRKITFHTARNTFAVTALKRGMSLKAVQLILGHSSIQTTEIYAQIANEFLVQEMQKMNRPVKGKDEVIPKMKLS